MDKVFYIIQHLGSFQVNLIIMILMAYRIIGKFMKANLKGGKEMGWEL